MVDLQKFHGLPSRRLKSRSTHRGKRWIGVAMFLIFAVGVCIATGFAASSGQPAFPGAEGEGANAVGGRGGAVIEVTNLNDSGTGSFRACVTASGPRTCVFRVGGTIALATDIYITNPYLTVAGQTAPGGGITIKGPVQQRMIFVQTHDVIIRYVRLRPGPTSKVSCCGGAIEASNGSSNVIIDHVSMSWAVDQIANVWYDSVNVTYQWDIISEPLNCSNHAGGECHGYNMILGDGHQNDDGSCMTGGCTFNNISVHHNLFSEGTERNPRVETGPVNIVNNVIYTNSALAYDGWGIYFDTEGGLSAAGLPVKLNVVNNYLKSGSAAVNQTSEKYVNACCGVTNAQVYVPSGNFNTNGTDIVDSNANSFLVGQPIPMAAITTTSAANAYTAVLGDAGDSKRLDCNGAWVANYDSVDTRVINDVKNGTGKVINDPSDVGGWPTLAAGAPCAESLHDGIPDQWKSANGLSTSDAGLAQRTAANGYTYLENYLNGINSVAGPNPPTDLKATVN
jgi:pectate lyase